MDVMKKMKEGTYPNGNDVFGRQRSQRLRHAEDGIKHLFGRFKNVFLLKLGSVLLRELRLFRVGKRQLDFGIPVDD